MKAIVYAKYGYPDLLQLKEVEKPIPGNDVSEGVEAIGKDVKNFEILNTNKNWNSEGI